MTVSAEVLCSRLTDEDSVARVITQRRLLVNTLPSPPVQHPGVTAQLSLDAVTSAKAPCWLRCACYENAFPVTPYYTWQAVPLPARKCPRNGQIPDGRCASCGASYNCHHANTKYNS